MDSRDRTRAMVESALITAIAVIFTLASIYIPLLGYALIFLPVPFIVIGAKHGIKYNILSVIAASIIVGSLTDPIRAIYISLVGGLSSLVMGYMIEKKYGFKKTVFFGSIASIISSIISLTLISSFAGMNVKDMLEQSFTIGNEINQGLFKNLGTDPEQLEEITEMMEHLKRMSIMLLPSSVVFGSVLFTYLNYIVSGVILKRMGYVVEKPSRFSEFSLPRNILMGSFLILILTYLIKDWQGIDFETLFTNVLYLFFIVYLIQGLAVANFYMEKRGLGRGARIILIVLFLIIPNLGLILMFMGLFDVIFNIRKLEN